MKKAIILIVVVVVLLVAYLALSKKGMNQDGNQANVISNFFSKDKATEKPATVQTNVSSSGKVPITPVIDRFSGNSEEDIQRVYIDGLKKTVPLTPVPR